MQYVINDDQDALEEYFKTKFLLVSDVHAPQVTRKINSEYTWMMIMFKKDRFIIGIFLKKTIKTGSENMFAIYRKFRNSLNKLSKDTKRNYYTSALNDAKMIQRI